MYIALIPQFQIKHSIQLANAMSKRERILFIVWKNIAKENVSNIGPSVEVEYLIKPPPKSLKNLRLTKETVNIVKEKKPDVVHIQNPYTWLCSGLSSLSDYPIVFTIHDPEPHLGQAKIHSGFMTKFTLKYAKRVIVTGNRMKELIVRRFSIPKDIVRVIPLSLDFSPSTLLDYNKFEEENNTILFFGRIWEYKGIEYLIKAEDVISKKIPNFKIIIAGGGDFERYRGLIKNKERYEIINEFIPNDKVSELFQKASLVVLPYVDASQTGIAPIAYLFKKPVVATDVGSLTEIVDDGETGMIVPPRDHIKLGEAIVELLSDEKKRKSIGERGYQKLQNELSWDRIAEKTIEVYKEII